MGRTIGIISIKGGVGKTTVAASLATSLVNEFGKKVLLVDANFSAPNIGYHMDVLEPHRTVHDVLSGKARPISAVHTRYGVDVMPGHPNYEKGCPLFKLKDRLAQLKHAYDFTIIDSSPNLNDELLSTMMASDSLFVVTTGDYPTLACSLRAAQVAKHRGTPIAGLVLNKVRDPKYELSLQDLEEATGIPIVAHLPDEKVHVASLHSRVPVSLYDKKSGFAREIKALAASLANKEQKPGFWKALLGTSFNKQETNRQVLREQMYSPTFKHHA